MDEIIIKRIQRILGVEEDGIIGPKTMEAARNYFPDPFWMPEPPSKPVIRHGSSLYGKPGAVPLKRFVPPYKLYYGGNHVSSIACHAEVLPYAVKALERVLATYGEEKIKKLGLDIYDGCYNNRNVRNGAATSMHAWGIAFDFNAYKNGNRTYGKSALFTSEEYDMWWICWLSVGARPFGLHNNRDYMHIEFTEQ